MVTETQKLDGIATQTASLSKSLDRAQTLLEVKNCCKEVFFNKDLRFKYVVFNVIFYSICERLYFARPPFARTKLTGSILYNKPFNTKLCLTILQQ